MTQVWRKTDNIKYPVQLLLKYVFVLQFGS